MGNIKRVNFWSPGPCALGLCSLIFGLPVDWRQAGGQEQICSRGCHFIGLNVKWESAWDLR